jgi:hypothetical protein
MKKISIFLIILTVTIITIISFSGYIEEEEEPSLRIPWGFSIYVDAGENRTAKVNETVYFNGSKSYCVSGCMGEINHPIQFLWDFNDNNGFQIDSTEKCPTYVYNESGIYNVTLIIIVPDPPFRAKDEDTAKDTVVITIIEQSSN